LGIEGTADGVAAADKALFRCAMGERVALGGLEQRHATYGTRLRHAIGEENGLDVFGRDSNVDLIGSQQQPPLNGGPALATKSVAVHKVGVGGGGRIAFQRAAPLAAIRVAVDAAHAVVAEASHASAALHDQSSGETMRRRRCEIIRYGTRGAAASDVDLWRAVDKDAPKRTANGLGRGRSVAIIKRCKKASVLDPQHG